MDGLQEGRLVKAETPWISSVLQASAGSWLAPLGGPYLGLLPLSRILELLQAAQ